MNSFVKNVNLTPHALPMEQLYPIKRIDRGVNRIIISSFMFSNFTNLQHKMLNFKVSLWNLNKLSDGSDLQVNLVKIRSILSNKFSETPVASKAYVI